MCFYSSIIFTHHFLSGSGISSTRKTWTYWIETSEGTWRWFMDCSITLMTRSWERAVIIQLGENSVEIVSRCINASWEGKKDEVTFFSVVSSDKTKGNVYKLKHRKFHLNIFFFFFTVRVLKLWNRTMEWLRRLHPLRYSTLSWSWCCLTDLVLGKGVD